MPLSRQFQFQIHPTHRRIRSHRSMVVYLRPTCIQSLHESAPRRNHSAEPPQDAGRARRDLDGCAPRSPSPWPMAESGAQHWLRDTPRCRCRGNRPAPVMFLVQLIHARHTSAAKPRSSASCVRSAITKPSAVPEKQNRISRVDPRKPSPRDAPATFLVQRSALEYLKAIDQRNKQA